MYSSNPNDKEPPVLSPPKPPRMAAAITNGDTTGSGSLSHSPVPWSSGVCDCCDDFNSCCLTCWCPCIAFGRIAEMVDRGSTACGVSGSLYGIIMCTTGCSCLYSCFYRSKLRGQYLLGLLHASIVGARNVRCAKTRVQRAREAGHGPFYGVASKYGEAETID